MAAMEKGRSKEYQIIFFTTLRHSNQQSFFQQNWS